jgi:hypothetical protein
VLCFELSHDTPGVPAIVFGGDANNFLPLSIIIPGAMHLVNNMVREVSGVLEFWSMFFSMLQVIESLWKENRIDRFIHYCLEISDYARWKPEFMLKLGSLYEERWGEIINFCRKIDRLLPILRLVWDAGMYVAGGGGVKVKADDTFQPQRVTEILKDNLFHGYFRMILIVQGIADELTAWCEGCPCHEAELIEDRQSRKKPRMAAGLADRPCPMKGKKLVELVTGKLTEVFDSFSQVAVLDLAIGVQVFLTAEQWGTVSRDMQRATATMRIGLEVKFDWTKRLPYMMAAMASTDLGTARACGLKATQLYDEQTEVVSKAPANLDPGLSISQPLAVKLAGWQGESNHTFGIDPLNFSQVAGIRDNFFQAVTRFHHPVTKLFLDPAGPLRPLLDLFIAGHNLHDLPELEKAVAQFRFFNIVERYVEAGHAAISRFTAGRHWKGRSGVKVSMARRLPELIREVQEKPDFFNRFAEFFSECRHRPKMPELLLLQEHPRILRIREAKPVNMTRLESAIREILYRTDSAGMLHNAADQARAHDKAKKRADLAAAKATAPAVQPVTEATLIVRALVDHFQGVAERTPDAVFQLPRVGTSSVSSSMEAFRFTRPVFDDDVDQGDSRAGDELLGRQRDEGHIFFKVVKAKPSNWHVVPMSKAAATKLRSSDVAVTLYQGFVRHGELVDQGAKGPTTHCTEGAKAHKRESISLRFAWAEFGPRFLFLDRFVSSTRKAQSVFGKSWPWFLRYRISVLLQWLGGPLVPCRLWVLSRLLLSRHMVFCDRLEICRRRLLRSSSYFGPRLLSLASPTQFLASRQP